MNYREDSLLDNFELNGTDEKEFRDAIIKIKEHTAKLSRSMKGLWLFSLRDDQDDDTKIRGFIMEPSAPMSDDALRPTSLMRETFDKIGDFSSLFDETMHTSKLMIWDEQTQGIYFVSDNMLNTFAQRVGVPSKILRVPTHIRHLFMAELMNVNEEATIVVRQYKKVGKVFAMMSGAYPKVDLTEITDVLDCLKAKSEPYELSCKEWHVDNFTVSIRLAIDSLGEELMTEYPISRKMTPCIELSTSDIGQSSFKARACWETEEGKIIYDKMAYVKEHRSMKDREEALDINETADKILEIFDSFDELPRRMQYLESHKITAVHGDNLTAVNNAYNAILNKSTINKIIGRHRAPTLKCVIQRGIDYKKAYTAADIIWSMIDVSDEFRKELEDRWKLDGETNRKYNEALSAIPYTCFGED